MTVLNFFDHFLQMVFLPVAVFVLILSLTAGKRLKRSLHRLSVPLFWLICLFAFRLAVLFFFPDMVRRYLLPVLFPFLILLPGLFLSFRTALRCLFRHRGKTSAKTAAFALPAVLLTITCLYLVKDFRMYSHTGFAEVLARELSDSVPISREKYLIITDNTHMQKALYLLHSDSPVIGVYERRNDLLFYDLIRKMKEFQASSGTVLPVYWVFTNEHLDVIRNRARQYWKELKLQEVKRIEWRNKKYSIVRCLTELPWYPTADMLNHSPAPDRSLRTDTRSPEKGCIHFLGDEWLFDASFRKMTDQKLSGCFSGNAWNLHGRWGWRSFLEHPRSLFMYNGKPDIKAALEKKYPGRNFTKFVFSLGNNDLFSFDPEALIYTDLALKRVKELLLAFSADYPGTELIVISPRYFPAQNIRQGNIRIVKGFYGYFRNRLAVEIKKLKPHVNVFFLDYCDEDVFARNGNNMQAAAGASLAAHLIP